VWNILIFEWILLLEIQKKKPKKNQKPKTKIGFARKISVGPSICSHLGNGIGHMDLRYGLWTFATKQRVLT
jgi:hypothetical protein